jgi:hypothetical protein
MINRSRLKIILPASLFFLCALFLLCGYFVLFKVQFEPHHQRNPSDDVPVEEFKFYQIDPFTILTDLKNDKKGAFHLLDKEPNNFNDIYPYGSFSWSSEDYLTIAKAHHLMLTGEALENGWKIYGSGNFYIERCQDEINGFDSAQIIFYKETPDYYLVTYMRIFPLAGSIYSANTEYFRNKGGLFQASELFNEAEVFEGKITAEDALQIAEKAGGKGMRQKLSNKGCHLNVSYFSSEVWYIHYSWLTNDLEFDLSFNIKANDGSYKVEQKVIKCERTICP